MKRQAQGGGLAAKMDLKLKKVRTASDHLNDVEAEAINVMQLMGEEAWQAYCHERGYSADIFRLFGDIMA